MATTIKFLSQKFKIDCDDLLKNLNSDLGANAKLTQDTEIDSLNEELKNKIKQSIISQKKVTVVTQKSNLPKKFFEKQSNSSNVIISVKKSRSINTKETSQALEQVKETNISTKENNEGSASEQENSKNITPAITKSSAETVIGRAELDNNKSHIQPYMPGVKTMADFYSRQNNQNNTPNTNATEKSNDNKPKVTRNATTIDNIPSKTINKNKEEYNFSKKALKKQLKKEKRTVSHFEQEELNKKMQHAFVKPVAKQVKEIQIGETIKIGELADKMSVKVSDVIKTLMNMGVMATINHILDKDEAILLTEEMGHKPVLADANTLEKELTLVDFKGELQARPPVVTIMGHVDHGKTSLLDKIRKSNIADRESGGITQHIGAYQVESKKHKKITFIDTPGHEAFTAMRARGANITDIVVVVVAADDGVMSQTKEAIEHAKSSNASIIVAVNKIDKQEANAEKTMQEISNEGLIPEEWGGNTQFVKVSAHTGQGIDDLLDAIVLQAEVLELKAPEDIRVKGVVLESRLEKGRGSVSSILVQEGLLQKGEFVLCGTRYGKIKTIIDYTGNNIECAYPAQPVEILGINGITCAGDELVAVDSERKAKELAAQRENTLKEKKIAKQQKLKLKKMYADMESGNLKTISVILRTDVQGSLEAITESLLKLSNDEVEVKIIAANVGGIRETDVNLALATNALLIGFNVRADNQAKKIIEREGVEVFYFSVIYEAIDMITRAMTGVLEPEFKDEILGIAEVRDVFKAPKIGAIAGCMVLEGMVKRTNPIRVLRENVVIYEGQLESLRRFKDDVQTVKQGLECGIGVKDYNDIKVKDLIEVYQRVEVKRTLK